MQLLPRPVQEEVQGASRLTSMGKRTGFCAALQQLRISDGDEESTIDGAVFFSQRLVRIRSDICRVSDRLS